MTGLTDRRGIAVASRAAPAAEAMDRTTRCFLGHRCETADCLTETLSLDPDMPLALAAKGHFLCLLGQRRLWPEAKAALRQGRAAATAHGNPARERAFLDSLERVCRGDQRGAVARLETWLDAEPLDALAIKLSHAWQFVLGDSHGMRRSTTRLIDAWDETVPDYGYVLGCHAFCLEETGDYDGAERIGRLGVGLEPHDAWGFHAVAHAFEMRDRPTDGAAWLESHLKAVDGCNNFGFHVYWHLALFYLALGRVDRVLDLYDSHVRASHTDDYRDISNGASMLWRLEADGVDVGNRWAELAERAAGHVDDHANAFADCHYAMALVGDHRFADADRFRAAVQQRVDRDTDCQATVLSTVGLAIVDALIAFGRGRYAAAARRLAPHRDAIQLVGGSHAQRDVFNQLLIESALRAGDGALTRELLAARTARRPHNGWAAERLARLAALDTGVAAGAA